MDSKNFIVSAFGVGIGVGVGLGLASKQAKLFSSSVPPSGVTGEKIEQDLLKQIVDGKSSNVTFDEFPYYLSEQTRVLLTSAAFVHLKQMDVSKYTRNLAPASRTILVSGPVELYPQMLAKALADYFEAKLLLLDVVAFSLKISSKYGNAGKQFCLKRTISEMTLEHMSSLLGSFSLFPQQEENRSGTLKRQSSEVDLNSRSETQNNPPKLRRTASSDISSIAMQSSPNPAPLRRANSWSLDEKLFIQSLYKVLLTVSKTSPIVLYVRDVDKLLSRSQRMYQLFQKMAKKLSGPILVLGSRTLDSTSDYMEIDEKISLVFPYNIEIKPPEDETHLVSWKSQLEEDMKLIKSQDNRNHIMEVLAENDLDCDDIDSICVADAVALSNYIEEIVVSAISYHLMHTNDPKYRNGKLVISSKSLSHGLSIFQKNKLVLTDKKLGPNTKTDKESIVDDSASAEREAPVPDGKKSIEKPVTMSKKDGENSAAKNVLEVPDNEFEKRIRPEVIPASEINVTFTDVGALDDIKESLQELVMLPLQRPDLFLGGLLKPCRGILLFGPPGTGKTMMAKAIAKEAKANFINVSMSTITSKWFGEDEKNVRALFSLAAKVSPTIIFVDEVDSMLGQRTRVGEHETMRKIKNEFMAHWDGLVTKPGERILVLAATNRPFDLDEAIIRRFERRIMVGLPTMESRESILKTLLAKEKVDEGLNYKELAMMTEGYSGSDLKNLCITAAYRPVRELIQKERLKDTERKRRTAVVEGKCEDQNDSKKENREERVVDLRPLNMEDLKLAKNQVAASFAAEGSNMVELKQWNEMYGEGGTRKKEQLSYFL